MGRKINIKNYQEILDCLDYGFTYKETKRLNKCSESTIKSAKNWRLFPKTANIKFQTKSFTKPIMGSKEFNKINNIQPTPKLVVKKPILNIELFYIELTSLLSKLKRFNNFKSDIIKLQLWEKSFRRYIK